MKQEVTKQIVRVGNSAGVILPKEWLNGKARIELISKPLNIRGDIIEILKNYLEHIIGVYLVGSYARNEQTEESDVDVIVITSDIDKKIKINKYDIALISAKTLKEILESNVLPLLPMLNEAKPLLNPVELDKYKDYSLTEKNMKFHIETTKSALSVISKGIELAKFENKELSENIVYSLILRLREVYIVDSLKNKEIATTKGFVTLLKNLAGSDKAYRLYLNVKNGGKESKEYIELEEAKKICSYIKRRIKEQEV